MFTFQTYADGQETSWSDTNSFRELVAVVGATTWEVMNAKKALNIVWEPFETFETETGPPDKRRKVQTQAGLEDSKKHTSAMKKAVGIPGKMLRRDGDPEAAFKSAKKILERHYTAPFLAHNTTEPMNFFAPVTNEKAELVGPIQTTNPRNRSFRGGGQSKLVGRHRNKHPYGYGAVVGPVPPLGTPPFFTLRPTLCIHAAHSGTGGHASSQRQKDNGLPLRRYCGRTRHVFQHPVS